MYIFHWTICGPVPQISRKVDLWAIWFYCKFTNFMLWALKRCIIWFYRTLWSEVMVVWIFQNVYISMDLAITFWHVSQNHFCQLHERFVIQGHIYNIQIIIWWHSLIRTPKTVLACYKNHYQWPQNHFKT